jgi:hypothetical protein
MRTVNRAQTASTGSLIRKRGAAQSGAPYGIGSGGQPVFVDEPAQDVAAVDRSGIACSVGWARWHQLQTAMWPSAVVVADILFDYPFQVTPRDHEQMVETVLSDGSDPAFGECVRFRGTCRSQDGLHTYRGEDVVEVGSELRIAVTDDESHLLADVLKIGSEVAGHLSNPRSLRISGDTQEVNDASFYLDHEEYVVAAERDRLDREEVGGYDPFGVGA